MTEPEVDPAELKLAKRDNSFREFRRLCATVADTASYLEKTEHVQAFFRWGKGEMLGNTILWCSIIVNVLWSIDLLQVGEIFFNSNFFGSLWTSTMFLQFRIFKLNLNRIWGWFQIMILFKLKSGVIVMNISNSGQGEMLRNTDLWWSIIVNVLWFICLVEPILFWVRKPYVTWFKAAFIISIDIQRFCGKMFK